MCLPQRSHKHPQPDVSEQLTIRDRVHLRGGHHLVGLHQHHFLHPVGWPHVQEYGQEGLTHRDPALVEACGLVRGGEGLVGVQAALSPALALVEPIILVGCRSCRTWDVLWGGFIIIFHIKALVADQGNVLSLVLGVEDRILVRIARLDSTGQRLLGLSIGAMRCWEK